MNKYNEITENDVSNWLSNRLIQLEKLAAQKQNDLKKAPEGVLRVAQRHGKPQYYLRTKKLDTKGEYIPCKKIDFAANLAQKDYDSKLLKLLTRQIRAIRLFRKSFMENGLAGIYEKLIPSRKKLVVPSIISSEEYARLWMEESHSGKGFSDDLTGYYTERGERVRSKSEIIIADLLFRSGVPYKYEVPVELKSYGTVYPDFVCLNSKNRREFVWEHFGMMDDSDYEKKALKKIQEYIESGYIPGKNLVVTFESSEVPLSTKNVKKYIEEFLL